MGRRKKNDSGCLGSIIYLFLLLCAMVIIISATGGVIAFALSIIIIVFFVKLIFRITKKIWDLMKINYDRRCRYGQPTLMNKFLNFLNMDNWQRKNGLVHNIDELPERIEQIEDLLEPEEKILHDNTETEEPDGFYNDRFYEDYIAIPRKTLVFTGNNFSEPAVQVCSALIISGSMKRGEKIKPNDYYSYFENLYGVVNIRKLHIWLYENGYLRNATEKEALNLYKVPELKTILDSMGLKKNGNKDELIDRIAENLDIAMKEKLINECDRYFRSEKGEAFLSENQDYILFHRKQYGVTFQEFCENRILQGRKRKFYDTIFQALNKKAFTYQIKGYVCQLEMIYYNLSESLYDEGKYELSLQNALYRLYFSTNLASNYYLFSPGNVKFDGIDSAKSRIAPEDTFNPYTMSRILELKQFFTEHLLDVVYSSTALPYCLFGKYDMLDAILDLYEEKFDAEFYTNYIRINYENYINKFL